MITAKTADNRAYLASCLQHSAQIPLRGTSDTFGTSDCVKSKLIFATFCPLIYLLDPPLHHTTLIH